jgi:hypothetical protein
LRPSHMRGLPPAINGSTATAARIPARPTSLSGA